MPDLHRAIHDRTMGFLRRVRRPKTLLSNSPENGSSPQHTSNGIPLDELSNATQQQSSQVTDTARNPPEGNQSHTTFSITRNVDSGHSPLLNAPIASQTPPPPLVSNHSSSRGLLDIGNHSTPAPRLAEESNHANTATDTLSLTDTHNSPPTSLTQAVDCGQDTGPSNSLSQGVDDASSPATASLAAERLGVAYEAFKTALGMLNEVAGAVPHLKAATAGFLKVIAVFERAVQNDNEFNDLTKHLKAILVILYRYKQQGLQSALEDHLQELSNQLNEYTIQIERLKEHSKIRRFAEGDKDYSSIVKILQDIGTFLQRFQMDLSLSNHVLNQQRYADDTIHQHLKPVEYASYKSRYGADNDKLYGCMPGTREDILKSLLAWAKDQNGMGPKVYWLNGMAGTGKSSIAHSFSRALDMEGILGASFFCTSSSSALSDASRIVPTIASMLSASFPSIRYELCRVFENPRDAALLDSVPEEFKLLIIRPIQKSVQKTIKTCQIVIIDAVNECSHHSIVESLIQTILDGVPDIPLKFFISSRPEAWIQGAFESSDAHSLKIFRLHDVAQEHVRRDIEVFLRSSLSTIANTRRRFLHNSDWPPEQELTSLLDQSDRLFIYAATAVRYIGAPNVDFQQRLTDLTRPGPVSWLQTDSMDFLYNKIMNQAFTRLEDNERSTRQNVLTAVVFLQTPLSADGLAALLRKEKHRIDNALSPFYSVIGMPSSPSGHVSIFHSSFRDFIVSPARSKTHCIDTSGGHRMLAEKCLQHLNEYLRRNICNLPEDTIGSRPHIIQDLINIPVSLQYSSLYWASHFAKSLVHPLANARQTHGLLSEFADEHLLHWFECLSAMGALESGIGSLKEAIKAIVKYFETHSIHPCIALLFEDARRCLQMGFEVMQMNCLNTYHSALTWIPNQSIMRKHYASSLHTPKVLGLVDVWGPLEHVMHHSSDVLSVTSSPDGRWVASAAKESVYIWRTTTGEMECVLNDHSYWVMSVAFSSDGSRIVTGSADQTVRIWRTADWKTEHVMKGHSRWVTSVGFSPDDTYVVSGSLDKTGRIWEVDTGEMKRLLDGHSDDVTSVAFSFDGKHVVSGSADETIRIWDTDTGAMVRVLMGHSNWVNSVALSPDGSCLVSGSDDTTVLIWNTHTWEVIHTLKGHLYGVTSVAFSSDGTQVVSGSEDSTIRIWSVSTGKMEHVLEGHQGPVMSVIFLHDSSHVVSGSCDHTSRTWNNHTEETLSVLAGQLRRQTSPLPGLDDHALRIWNTVQNMTLTMKPYTSEEEGLYNDTLGVFSPNGSHSVSSSNPTLRMQRTGTAEIKRVLNGHSNWVNCVAFSPCGNRVVSVSYDNTIRIWDAATGEEKHVLKGHSYWVMCVAFSPSGSHVVSGAEDNTVRLWNAATGVEELMLTGHLLAVSAVAFAHDDSYIASGDWAGTVRIWSRAKAQQERTLKGHLNDINSVAFSYDSVRVVSGSSDGTVRIWNVATGVMEHVLKDDLHQVVCVGFSHNGSCVVSGDIDGIIRIWNLTTGESTLASGSCQLPGGSQVNPLGGGRFQIMDRIGEEVVTGASVSSDYKWLVGGSSCQDCWVASEYRPGEITLSGSKVCIGYHSGNIVILDLATRFSYTTPK